jgi:catechol 2,3-dioxygenase-like lactoylglutathione lyase family enzyme
MFTLERIDHVALAVRDVAAAARWYCDVLGFEPMHDDIWNGVPLFVGKSNVALALFAAKDSAEVARTGGILHFAFRTDRENFQLAQRELKSRAIKFEFQDHEISHSIYFRDPDEHEVEITTYEVDEKQTFL